MSLILAYFTTSTNDELEIAITHSVCRNLKASESAG
jgi:hypothetical protein